ncbi:hypothetical protein EGH73_11190 [Epilithonimonas hominis]|uniref:Uncharacterized protein n=1 Tax=Epilithonimonas hominis TaxID=420404 RepID=A0A3N0X5E6_9FLAO|nr:hypothetical protein EGH73_11190 [Epilithonimonas hominis]
MFEIELSVKFTPHFSNTFSVSNNAIIDQVQINSQTLYNPISILSTQFQIAFPLFPISMSLDRLPFCP